MRTAVLEARQRDREGHTQCPVRISSMGNCPRELALLLDGTPDRPRAVESVALLERGTQRGAWRADLLSRALEATGCATEHETEVWLPIGGGLEGVEDVLGEFYSEGDLPVRRKDGVLQVRGHTDWIGRYESADSPIPEGETWVVDFKTAGVFPFRKLDSEGSNRKYDLQVALYCRAIQEVHPGPVRGFVHYEAQDSDPKQQFVGCEDRWFEVDLEDMQVECDRVIEELRTVLAALLAGMLVGVDKHPELEAKGAKLPWQCDYCNVGPQACGKWGEVANKGTLKKPKWSMV